MFLHPTEDYDVLVHLDRAVLPRYFANIAVDPAALTRRKGKYANLSGEDGSSRRPGFDPATLFFTDLQRVYGNTFKIFHDVFGGDRYGIVWDPSLREPRPFRVLGQFSSAPIGGKKVRAAVRDVV
jgi:U3 small nucleolar RNA-associated protein 22